MMTACHLSKLFMTLLIMTCKCTTSPVVPDEGSSYCGKGTFVNRRLLNGSHFCDLCAEDTFIDSERHTFEYCQKCKQFKQFGPWEKVVETSPCTREHDTFIKRCESGFYLDTRPAEYGCHPCPPCHKNYFSECCDNQVTVTVRSVSEEHPTIATTNNTNSPTQDLITTNNTCEEIQNCHEFNLTKCSNGSESKNILCKECPICQSIIASANSLSTSAKIGITIACFVVFVIIGAIISIVVYKKRYQKYQQANTNNNSNN